MHITIIGGGFTGLTAAYTLINKGHTITLLEKESFLGGLAQGFKHKQWAWHLESAYHHLFTNDTAILALIHTLELDNKLIIKRPITATLWNNQMYQLDSASSLLQFPALSPLDRIRTGLFIALMKSNPFWKPLEQVTAKSLAQSIGGMAGWKVIWEPLMTGKFGTYASDITASWLWSRIKKRTPSLAYIEGGFQTLVDRLHTHIHQAGGTILTDTTVKEITPQKSTNADIPTFTVRFNQSQSFTTNCVLLTTPTPIAQRIVPFIPQSYFKKPLTIPHLHAQVLIIESKQPLLDKVYWLNITDRSFPFLAVVSHTNYMDKKHYANHHITYIGNYLPPSHPYLSYSKEKLWKHFYPYIKRINSGFNPTSIINSYLFKAPFAQPVHTQQYSTKAPPLKTPVKGIYIANMDSIYPWDRGTNYAVELGIKASEVIVEDL